jgi:hypothetical protein
MKKNYRTALLKAKNGGGMKLPKAQTSTIKPRGFNKYQSVGETEQVEGKTPQQHVVPPVVSSGPTPPTPPSIINPDLNLGNTTAHQGLDPMSRSVVPENSQLRQRSWLGTLGTRIGNIFRPDHRDLNVHGTYIDKATRKNIPTYEFDLGRDINSGAYVDPTSIAGSSLYMKKGGGVGSSNYMKALKTAKKGGSKR